MIIQIRGREFNIYEGHKYAVYGSVLISSEGIVKNQENRQQILSGVNLRALAMRHPKRIVSIAEIKDTTNLEDGDVFPTNLHFTSSHTVAHPIVTHNVTEKLEDITKSVWPIPSGTPNPRSPTTDHSVGKERGR